jgi:hypothetical protein
LIVSHGIAVFHFEPALPGYLCFSGSLTQAADCSQPRCL